MNLVRKIRIKARTLTDYYIFQMFGVPKVSGERISKSVIRKLLPKDPIIIDCGAHDGADSIELAKIIGGQIHAFEPVPELFDKLKKRTQKLKNVFTYRLALSNVNEMQTFHISEGESDASSSLLAPKGHLTDHPKTVFKKKIEVSAVTLDAWAVANSVTKVDLLWLDMQGFELQMLKESKDILSKVSVIHTEISTKETYEGVTLYPEYKAFLESKGFRVLIEAIPAGWDMGNVLFVRQQV